MEIVAALVFAGVALVLAVSALRNMPDRRPPPHLRGDPPDEGTPRDPPR